jgi:hypothetical protein
MHDPMTVAHEIRYPWWKYRPWPKRVDHRDDNKWVWDHGLKEEEKKGRSLHWRDGYRESFIVIWHVDPERDGSDDSCGWSFPRLSIRQRQRIKSYAWFEGRDPYFLRSNEEKWTGSIVEAEQLYRALILRVAQLIEIPMTFDEAARRAAIEIHAPDCVPCSGMFCFKPGYHTNIKEDTAEEREEVFASRMASIARGILSDRRPWWRHPRWHFWHWKIQCEPLCLLKRRLFSRCATCGGRFHYGESVVSNSWDSPGPRWFRGEVGVHHTRCQVAPSKEGSVPRVEELTEEV